METCASQGWRWLQPGRLQALVLADQSGPPGVRGQTGRGVARFEGRGTSRVEVGASPSREPTPLQILTSSPSPSLLGVHGFPFPQTSRLCALTYWRGQGVVLDIRDPSSKSSSLQGGSSPATSHLTLYPPPSSGSDHCRGPRQTGLRPVDTPLTTSSINPAKKADGPIPQREETESRRD